MKRANIVLKTLLLVLVVSTMSACDTLEDLNPFENEQEVERVVEAIADDGSFLTVDGIEYLVTNDTEFEGIAGLADLSVGDEVEIEYSEEGGTRVAEEIELAGVEDDD